MLDIFRHMGTSSRYQRFNEVLTDPDPTVVESEALRMARIAPPHGSGWLAFADLPGQPSTPVAGAHYVRTAAGAAELSVSVRDDMQGRGIAQHLLALLAEEARAEGYDRIVATFQAGNRAVWTLIHRLPFKVTTAVHGTNVEITVDLQQRLPADEGVRDVCFEGTGD
jgi:GNAT superfamily N-acetyltransferase